MKTKYIISVILIGIVALFAISNQAKATDKTKSQKEITKNDLTKSDIEGIKYMREEEKLAHDVYTFYAEQYNIPIFRNISRSETQHQKAVMWLMGKYGVKDISKPNAGEFSNTRLQKMYNDLTQGTTLIDGLKAGALIEEQDITDLKERLAKTDNADIQRVYGNLIRGSENHLRAFVRNLSRRGIDYQPKVLNRSTFSDIVQQ